ncbi:unnamed protein product [Camellia sinensis]
MISSLPVLQWIKTPNNHRRRGKLHPRNTGRFRTRNIHNLVIAVRFFGQKRSPQPVRDLGAHQWHSGEPELRFGALFATEERLYRDHSGYLHSPEFLLGGADRRVVGYVGAGAVAGDEAAAEIGDRRQNGVVEEFESVESVVELGGEAVFGSEAVVDGDDDGG